MQVLSEVINFAPAMKKIAAILLIIFTLVQVAQVYSSIYCDTTSIFIADEEKSAEKTDIEKKAEKKDFLYHHITALIFSGQTNAAIHQAIHFKHPPCLETQTPPPDFC